jgi:adenosylmethionine-8-amino-7-oxononanoate aminotransferase
LIRIARQHDVFIIESDAWGPLQPERPTSFAMLAQDKVIARAMPQGDILGFAPPFCLTRQEADTVVAATVKAVKTVLG